MDKKSAQDSMADMVARIKAEDFSLSEVVSRKVFRRAPDAPSRKWSWLNQVAMIAENTADARTFNQWKEVGRTVKKGSHAFPIWAPNIKTVTEEKDGKEEKVDRLFGFRTLPVFAYESTEGEEIPAYHMELDTLPLVDIAKHLGVSVMTAPAAGQYYGVFKPFAQQITLCTNDPSTWLHELSHAIDFHLHKAEALTGYAAGELVAETCAAIFLDLFGLPNDLRRHSEYLRHYAEKDFLRAFNAVMNRIEAVVMYVVNFQEKAKEVSA